MRYPPSTSAAILAGGKSQRFGSDKALLKIDNRYLVCHIAQQIQPLVPTVYLVTKRPALLKKVLALDKPSKLQTIHVLRDPYRNHAPLYGILSVLKMAPTPYVFITACDMPLPNQELLRYLFRFIRHDYHLIVPYLHGRFQPLFALYHKHLLPLIEEAIHQDSLSLQSLIRRWIESTGTTQNRPKIKIIHLHPLPKLLKKTRIPFANINTPDDWKRFQHQTVKLKSIRPYSRNCSTKVNFSIYL